LERLTRDSQMLIHHVSVNAPSQERLGTVMLGSYDRPGGVISRGAAEIEEPLGRLEQKLAAGAGRRAAGEVSLRTLLKCSPCTRCTRALVAVPF
jgi:hypothetical protein